MQTTISQLLEQKTVSAFAQLNLPATSPVILRESARPEFGDYQVNGLWR